MSQLFTSGGQSIGASASASVLSMNIQGWFPLGLTVLISLQVQGPLKSLFPYFCIPSLPWLATVWICPLALREDLGGWMKLISCKQETQDMKSLFAQKPTESYSVSVDSLQDIPQWNFEDWFTSSHSTSLTSHHGTVPPPPPQNRNAVTFSRLEKNAAYKNNIQAPTFPSLNIVSSSSTKFGIYMGINEIARKINTSSIT